MIDLITILIGVIVMIMFVLLGVLCILYFKSKNKTETTNTATVGNGKDKKAPKSYSVESVFDFMEFDKIEDNMICTKNGAKYVMVVEC